MVVSKYYLPRWMTDRTLVSALPRIDGMGGFLSRTYLVTGGFQLAVNGYVVASNFLADK